MFFLIVIIPLYVLAIIAMFYMNSVRKAFLFLLTLLGATALLYLFTIYPMPSAVGVLCLMGLFAAKLKF